MFKQLRPVSNAEQQVSDREWAEKYWTEALTQLPTSNRLVHERQDYGLIDPLISSLPEGSILLDAGCGTGEWVLYYAARGYAAAGIDISHALIEKVKQSHPEAEFHVRDIRETGFPDESFDAYVSWGVWEHFIEGPLPCATEAHRILKPGGIVCATVPFFSGRLQKRFRRVKPWEPKYSEGKRFYQWRFTVEEFHRVFEGAGFRVEWVRPIGKLQGLRMAIMSMAVSRMLGPTLGQLLRRALIPPLYPLLSQHYISHMLMAVARKESGRSGSGVFE